MWTRVTTTPSETCYICIAKQHKQSQLPTAEVLQEGKIRNLNVGLEITKVVKLGNS